ncbi:MAG: Crp/Fnr family transcriptional regulator [Desulfovibrio sp.]|nr:Crp/Fnr family transcriptional regulator [Desulfovibrio sp.]
MNIGDSQALQQALTLGPLAALSDKERHFLTAHARVHTFSQGELLFREGDVTTDPMILLNGMVKLCRHTTQGKECVLHLVRPAKILDVGVLFYEDVLPITAVAVQNSTTVRLEKKALLTCVQDNTSLSIALMKTMCLRQRLFINKIAGSQGRISVASRVAAWLLHRAKMEKSATMHLGVTQEILARQMGISRESLSRELSALAADGFIDRRHRTITLLDPEALRARAES